MLRNFINQPIITRSMIQPSTRTNHVTADPDSKKRLLQERDKLNDLTRRLGMFKKMKNVEKIWKAVKSVANPLDENFKKKLQEMEDKQDKLHAEAKEGKD